MQRQFLVAQVAEHQGQDDLRLLTGSGLRIKEAELGTISATVDKLLDAVIPTIEERVNIRKALSEYSNPGCNTSEVTAAS